MYIMQQWEILRVCVICQCPSAGISCKYIAFLFYTRVTMPVLAGMVASTVQQNISVKFELTAPVGLFQNQLCWLFELLEKGQRKTTKQCTQYLVMAIFPTLNPAFIH